MQQPVRIGQVKMTRFLNAVRVVYEECGHEAILDTTKIKWAPGMTRHCEGCLNGEPRVAQVALDATTHTIKLYLTCGHIAENLPWSTAFSAAMLEDLVGVTHPCKACSDAKQDKHGQRTA